MKRIILSLFLALSLAVAGAQNTTDITPVIKALNDACPTSAGPGLTFTEIELSPGGIVLHYEVNEQNYSVDQLKDQKDMLHDVYVSELVSTSNPNMQALRAYSIASSQPIIYRFTGAITDEGFDITLLPSDLK